MDLSIIIPTYNEKENIRPLINRIIKAFDHKSISYEIIFVDDNSPDGTAKEITKFSKKYPVKVLVRKDKKGLSSAVLDGTKIAKGKVIAVMDSDLQHPPELLPKMYKELINSNSDIVVASRYVKGGSVGNWGFHRRLTSKIAILLARIVLPQARAIHDPMSGYFMFKKSVIHKKIKEMNPKGFKILLELLVKGDVKNVSEVPFVFGNRVSGKSKLNSNEIITYLFYLLDLAPTYWKFAIVGGIGTIINLLVLFILKYIFGIPHWMSSFTAIEISLLSNFFFNDYWTFHRRGGGWLLKLIKFHLSSVIGVTVQWGVSIILFYALVVNSLLSQFVGILFGFVINYLLSDKFVWK